MRRALPLALVGWLAFAIPAFAFLVPINIIPKAATYTGPGDVASGALAYWGLNAISGSYASGLGKLANVCTPSDAACADVSSDANGNFNIGAVGALSGCNNSTTICTIKGLYDQIGTSCTGTGTNCNVTNATIATRPTLIVAGAANGCTNTSLPCMGFVRASTQCLISQNTLTTSQPLSELAVVTRTGTTSAVAAIIGLQATGALNIPLRFAAAANTVSAVFGAILSATAADSSWHVIQAVANGASGSVVVDGTTTTGNDGTNTPISVIGIGCMTSGTSTLDGKMAAAGIWTGSVTSLNSNAHTYWNF